MDHAPGGSLMKRIESPRLHGQDGPATEHHFAQTNLQLYNQLLSTGYTGGDLALIRRCYDLASELFSASYRPTSKPFLAHLVGTASILAWLKAPISSVATGLLHAAFEYGDFGPHASLGRRQALLRARVGSDLERMVEAYTDLEWNTESVSRILADVPTTSAEASELLRVRLANELEDFLDLGLLYCRKGDDYHLDREGYVDQTIALAQALDVPQLANALAVAIEQNRTSTPPPPDLRSQRGRSYVQAPASYRRRRSWSDGVSVGKRIVRGTGRRLFRGRT
jgi:HD domain